MKKIINNVIKVMKGETLCSSRNGELSTLQKILFSKVKTRKGKKKHSPLNPYKEKGQRKEAVGINYAYSLPNACGRVREGNYGRHKQPLKTAERREITKELDRCMEFFGGNSNDRKQWAWIANRVGAELFSKAVKEMMEINCFYTRSPYGSARAFQKHLNAWFPNPNLSNPSNPSNLSNLSNPSNLSNLSNP